MTLEQKCALLCGYTTFGTRPYASLGIPALEFSDGPHGLRHQADHANHLGIGESLPATCFPCAVTLADTWDTDLLKEIGKALGEEAASQGVNVILGPGVNIKRSPLCGRNFEYFSEDPYLAGKLGSAYVQGVQSTGIGACVKHFAANSQETRRQASDSILDERTLRELYLTAFEIIVKEAHPACVMTSYNRINGEYANENKHLLKDILRDEWGYTGVVVSDWGGSNDHVKAVKCRSTFEMPGGGLDSTRSLIHAVKQGEVDESDVDQCVEDALNLILPTDAVLKQHPHTFDKKAHHALAQRAAAAGIVLLKNEKVAPLTGKGAAHPLLPLAAGTKVAVIGDFAGTPRYQGSGSSRVNATQVDNLIGAVKGSALDFVGYEPGFDRTDTRNDEKAQKALQLAAKADAILLNIGLSEAAEAEGLDRTALDLADNQAQLIEALAKTRKPMIIVLSSGGVLTTPWSAFCQSLLYEGLGGQAGASAVVQVITGEVNPSGKLAESWPNQLSETPLVDRFPSDTVQAQYREGPYVGYRYYETAHVAVAYPFGFGLSYTTFAYSRLRVQVDEAQRLPKANVSFDLTNTGTYRGAEIAQIYVAREDAGIFRPERELKGFVKVALDPQETKRVTIELNETAFRYFDVETNAWESESGVYRIYVGTSSADLYLYKNVKIKGTAAPHIQGDEKLLPYHFGRVQQVSRATFEVLLGHPIPKESPVLDRNLCVRDLNRGKSPILWLFRAIAQHAVKTNPNTNTFFVYNMPLRSMAKNAGNLISMGFVDALVREAKGWGLAGVVPAVIVQVLTGNFFTLVWFLWFVAPLLIELIKNAVLNAQGERTLAVQDKRS